MNRLTTTALIALTATSALALPAIARTNATSELISATSANPAVHLALNAEYQFGEPANAEPADLVRITKKSKSRRRTRPIQPPQDAAQMAGRNGRAQTAAQLDCSIQSHPDCQPNHSKGPQYNYADDFSP